MLGFQLRWRQKKLGWVVIENKNTTSHSCGALLKKNKDKRKGWMREFLPRKVIVEYIRNKLNPK